MCAVSFERTISKNEDLVCLTDAGDSLGYKEGCRVSFEIVDGFAEFCIRCKVKRTRAVVQNQDFRFFYQRTRNRKTLFLSAGEVFSVLLQHKIELILFAFYDFFRLGCGERLPDFCIGGVLFAPLHIVTDAAFKEHCSLLNNTDFIAELFFCVILYILAVYHDVTAGRIVETGNQADQRRFSTSGTADDSDGLAAFCGKTDIR